MQLWLKEGNVVELNLSFIDIKYGNYEEGGKIVFLINNLLLLAKNNFIIKNYLRQYSKNFVKNKK